MVGPWRGSWSAGKTRSPRKGRNAKPARGCLGAVEGKSLTIIDRFAGACASNAGPSDPPGSLFRAVLRPRFDDHWQDPVEGLHHLRIEQRSGLFVDDARGLLHTHR